MTQLADPPASETTSEPAVPEPEKVGSRTISYEEQKRHLQEIEEAERVVAAREEEWEELKAETKTAKDAFDASVEKLRKVIRSHKPGADPLFDGVKERAVEDSGDEPKPEKPLVLEWRDDSSIGGEVSAESRYAPAQEDPDANAFFIDRQEGEGFVLWLDDLKPVLPPEVFGGPLTFATLDEAKARCQEIENAFWEKAHGLPPKPTVPADDAWRAVPLDSLKPEIPAKKLQLLAEHTPPITTIGDWQAWCEKKGDPWFWRDIKGFGEGGRDAMEAALMPFWEANAKTPLGKLTESAEKVFGEQLVGVSGTDDHPVVTVDMSKSAPDDFTDDAIDQSTRETVAKIEKHLVIEVARRTSGPWQCGWWLAIGKVERMNHLGAGGTFPTRAEAIDDAITAVGGAIERANAEIVGKANLAAAREVRAALEAARPTA